jgi:glycosidase
MKHILISCLLALALTAAAQNVTISRVEPAFWWDNMARPDLTLTFYGSNASLCKVSADYPGVEIAATTRLSNPNYLFVRLRLDTVLLRPGIMPLVLEFGANKVTLQYEFKRREQRSMPRGLDGSDFIYLIMPDRFANGDPSNDKFPTLRDTICDRKSPYLRHGGDFKGILDHLDYFQELGITALWLNPVIINDNEPVKESHGNLQAGYHGYHFTDHYQVDPRFGGNEGYRQLTQEMHKRGMKIIQDAVYNHVGKSHWMYLDPPSPDWFNVWPEYTQTSHKEATMADPHAASIDQEVMTAGWFTPFLPDLDCRHPLLADYLIQHAIWSTEHFGLDAWRIDTYKYNDLEFMNRCNAALVQEFPGLSIFGETWVTQPASLAYFVENNLQTDFRCNLESTCDFPTYSAILASLTENWGWEDGLNRIYGTLAQDFVYRHPEKLITFVDNHDTDRFYSVIKEDFRKFKMGMGWLLTSRGIPQMYYGTEILMKNFKNPTDAEVRQDFPGGFPGDKVNKFSAKGRTAQEEEAFQFIKALAGYRKGSEALTRGKLTHYLPQQGVYVYFRHTEKQTVMVILNQNASEQEISTARFAERMRGFRSAKNIMTGAAVSSLDKLRVQPMSITILELQ